AGPVENNCVRLTNSPWIIEREELINQFSSIIRHPFKVGLINDFEALAYGLDLIEDSDVIQLNDRKPRGDVKLVCGPGTGLGLSALRSLTPNRHDVIALPTEGGHQSFAAETAEEREISDYFKQPFVSYEHVLSGSGLKKLYSFFCEKAGRPNTSTIVPEDIVAQYGEAHPIAMETLTAFASILGT